MKRGNLVMGLLAILGASAAPQSRTKAAGFAAPATLARLASAHDALFAVVLRPGPAWRPGRPFAEQGLRPHFDYWMRQFRAGRVATAGPLGDDGGLVLLSARDLEEATSIMRADPAVTAGVFVAEVRSYAPPMVNPEALPKAKPKQPR